MAKLRKYNPNWSDEPRNRKANPVEEHGRMKKRWPRKTETGTRVRKSSWSMRPTASMTL